MPKATKYRLLISLITFCLCLLLFTPITRIAWQQYETKIQTLINKLKDPESDVRMAAAQALEVIGPEAKAVVPALIEALKDGDGSVCEAAAVALGKIGPEAKPAVPALIETLKDWNEKVRKAAAWSLGKIAPETKDAVTTLIEALKDKDEHEVVREAAAVALEKINTPEAQKALEEYRKKPD